MARIDVETTKFILQRNLPDIRKVNEIMQEIEMELKAEEEERANRPPPIKKQFAILVSDPSGELADKNLVGWVVQIPEQNFLENVPFAIRRAAYDFNSTPKGRRMPVETIGEACEVVPAKFFKEQLVWIKTKVPVLAVTCPNKIPMEASDVAH